MKQKNIKTPIVSPIPDDNLIKQYEMETYIKFPSDYKKFIKRLAMPYTMVLIIYF
ncbi:SMI1/KNR4 family protein [Bartonella sp. HY406]|uniref:SMI1/KNR4 family protein n=1 Tax=Bartonella sp. HY406 TaxID=2979331 RepID=UPI003965C456